MAQQHIVIGGASGFWGDAALATPQLLATGALDFLVYDYLAEVTMSILARARAADDSKGYATDFVSGAMAPNLAAIAEQGVRVISNAGGMNPEACATALRQHIGEQGLSLRVAVVNGDNLLQRADQFSEHREMFTGAAFPPLERVASVNAYLGAFPIARALDLGADIVVTGRCVDSAVTLGACIHAFGWARDSYNQLAQGSLAGHILECGTQATGGNFTDWERIAAQLDTAGYPLATIAADGSFEVHKPTGTGGEVSVGTVAEQMLYEIGDPRCYALPDVICDFSAVRISQSGNDRVRVSGALGHGAPLQYKVSATWADGFRAGHTWTYLGRDAARKARLFAESVFRRSNATLAAAGQPPLSETAVELLGTESHYGTAATVPATRELDMKIAARHPSAAGIGCFLKEMTGLALTAPPGLAGFAGARAKPSPVVRLFSLLLDKSAVDITVNVEGKVLHCNDLPLPLHSSAPLPPPLPTVEIHHDTVELPLEALAWARSGDKGNKANIGIIARRPEYLPYIAEGLSTGFVHAFFQHFLADDGRVERFYLPGSHALNFLLHEVLGGGGVASLRNDAQGKSYAQLLLDQRIAVARELPGIAEYLEKDEP